MADRPITARQCRILRAIVDTTRERGYPPSMREIGKTAGLASTSSVRYHLVALRRMGYLNWVPGKPRAIEVVLPIDWLREQLQQARGEA